MVNLAASSGSASITRGGVPVEIGKATSGKLFGKPAHNADAAVVAGADEIGAAAGKASEHRGLASDIFDASLNFVEVGKEIVKAGVDVGIIVGISMKPNCVPFVIFTGDKGVVTGAGDKESDFHVVFFKDIEEFGGIRSRTIIKGKINDFLTRFGNLGRIGDFGKRSSFGRGDGRQAASGSGGGI